MRRFIVVFSLLAAGLPVVASQALPPPVVQAGYGVADNTWRVGAGGGQYTEKDPNLLHVVQGDEVDPFNHSWTQRHSYGVASRVSYRTIVVEGTDGRRIALVKSDHYLASDALARRAAQILADGTDGRTSKVGYKDILFMTSHNHNSPFYTSPSWGPWLFQDLFDLRAFEYEARQFALSIERAEDDLRPARMGATVIEHKIYKGNIAGATLGDDGTPAGYPDSHADFGVSVVRFDEADTGDPIAVFVNHGQHPESHDGYDLITADYLGPLERMVERETRAPLVFSQGDVGSAEGPYDSDANFTQNDVLPDGVIRAWAHVGHSQTERGARYLADDIIKAYNEIETGTPLVPFSTSFDVGMAEAWVPPPISHPYSSVSNCRTEPTVEGNPGSPILGLPDCARLSGAYGDVRSGVKDATGVELPAYPVSPLDPIWEELKAAGMPLPEHYDAPSWLAVEENARLRLQAVRLGEVVLASCSCESQMDLILNFESRANDVASDIFDGYDYPCTDNMNGTWTCQAGRKLTESVTISDAKYKRMRAQVHNPADGWDDPENAVASNTEPADPANIKGNFTKEELAPGIGYKLPIGVGHAAEYQGYVVSYREYMIRDHYRKALTAYGSHTADFMSTRMVRLAGHLKGAPMPAAEFLQERADIDEVRAQAFMTLLGQVSSAAYDIWNTALPNDLGTPGAVTQPKDITRFNAATFTWRGGSNAVDNPLVRVERLVTGTWTPFADQSGEVQTQVDLPDGLQGVVDTYTSSREWHWTANFEAFDSFPAAAVPGGQTPDGTYRFVVDGVHRAAGADAPYTLTSDEFEVSRWTGITVRDPQREPGGSVSFIVDPIAYPRTYASEFRYIHDDGSQVLCRTCSFRPWARKGEVAKATVRVVRSGGAVELVDAVLTGGRWVAATALGASDTATLEAGGVVDAFGETNGSGLSF